MNVTNRQRVDETSQVGEVRRLAASISRTLGFDEARVGNVSIVATEMATNLVKHAGGGEIILLALQTADASGIEMLSLDKGPGIKDVGKSLCDGQSSSGSLGTGLGAVRRLSSLFDLYSRPDKGTAVLSHIWRQQSPGTGPFFGEKEVVSVAENAGRPDRRLSLRESGDEFSLLSRSERRLFEVGVVCLPVATEKVCGDAWAVHYSHQRTLIMVADGLGHGQYAAKASAEAVKVFENDAANSSPAELIARMHTALRSTRGAAVAITEVLPGQRIVRYAGVGNISGRIFSGEADRYMVSHNGTVGLEAPRIQEFTYDWPEDGTLILYSDGLATHWKLEDYPGLKARHPALVAGVLFRDHNRIRDDGTVLVVRETRMSP